MSEMPTYDKLRARAKAFVRHYVETGDATAAWLRVRPHSKSPGSSGCKMRRKPKIAQAIAEFELTMQDEVRSRIYANLDGLLQIANWDPIWLQKPIEEWPSEVRRTVQGIDVEDLFDGAGKDRTRIGHVRKYRIASKIEARKLLLQYQRVLVDKHEFSGPGGAPLTPPVINIGFPHGGPGDPGSGAEGS